MQQTIARRSALKSWGWMLAGLLAVLLVALWVATETNTNFFAHSHLDSYTKQAMAWRDGRIALDQDYPWLELAIYNGEYYVSFPPVPAIPMYALTFFFGEQTPSALMTLLYFLGSYIALYWLGRRYLPAAQAAMASVCFLLAGSLLDLTVSGNGFGGGVWYQAQLLGLLFTALAFLLVDGRRPGGWAAGLICIALAVGCRPFNAIYVPALLLLLFRRLRKGSVSRTLARMLPYVIVPALIACAYGAYNYARFGNPLEFGHAYLPELEQAGEGMFVLSRLPSNIQQIFRPMQVVGGLLYFPTVSGFAVYLTNPMLWMAPVRTAGRALRRKADAVDGVLLLTVLIHGLLLLTHRTNGGWQYGTRYLCDLLPALCYLFVRGRLRLRRWEVFAFGLLVAINVLGTIAFHYL